MFPNPGASALEWSKIWTILQLCWVKLLLLALADILRLNNNNDDDIQRGDISFEPERRSGS